MFIEFKQSSLSEISSKKGLIVFCAFQFDNKKGNKRQTYTYICRYACISIYTNILAKNTSQQCIIKTLFFIGLLVALA